MPYNVVLQFVNEKTAIRGTGGVDWFRISKLAEIEAVRFSHIEQLFRITWPNLRLTLRLAIDRQHRGRRALPLH